MGYIDFTKQQLQNKIEDLTKKLSDLEIINKSFYDFSNLENGQTDLSTLLKILPGIVYQTTTDENRKIKYISSQSRTLFGKSMEDMVNEILLDYIYDDDKEKIRQSLAEAIEQKSIYQLEYRVIDKSSKVRWVYDQGVAVEDPNENFMWLVGYIQDITDKVEVEKNHREVEKRLSRLIENLKGVVYRCDNDKEWTMDYLSNGCKDLTGYEIDELIKNKKMSWQDLIYPDDRQKVHDVIEEAIQNKEPFRITYRIITAENQIRYVWEQGQAVRDKKGKIESLEGFISDITDNVKSLELYESESDFNNMLIDNSPGYIITTDINGYLTSINDGLLNDLGKTEKELLGKHFIGDHIPEEQREFITSEINKIIKFKKPRLTESNLIDKNGKIIQVEWFVKPLFKESELYAIYAFGINVTQKKEEERQRQQILEMEKALAKASAKLIKTNPNMNQVLKTLGRAIDADRAYIFNLFNNGKIMSNTYEYCRKGVDPQIDNLQNLETRLFPWFMDLLKKNETLEISNVSSLSKENKLLREHLEEQSIKSLLIVPIFTKSKGLIGFIGFDDIRSQREWTQYEKAVLRLISEMIVNFFNRKEYEEKLLLAKEEAEKSEKLKSEFLAQISHEIRTPINVMMSFTSLLKEKYKNDEADEETSLGFRAISNAGKRLIRTIDLLLNVSEIQAGSYDYQPKVVDLNVDVIQNLIPEFTELAKSKKIEFKTSFIVNQNCDVFADEYSAHQIIANLVDNAIKYTEKGEVKITVDKDGEGKTFVEVSDTGIGISKKYLPNLFSEFTQEDIGYTRKFEGSGLGMALVKKYCELNNADISVESTKGKGTKFRVTFPNFEENWDTT